MNPVSVSLVIESNGNRVTITPTDAGDVSRGRADLVAGYDFGRLARVAACVVACLAQPTSAATDQGGDQLGGGEAATSSAATPSAATSSAATPSAATGGGSPRGPLGKR